MERINNTEMSTILQSALNQKIITPEDRTVSFYNFTRLENILNSLKNSFPCNAIHSIAVKANPALEILKFIRRKDYAAEVASLGELHIAIHAGFAPEKIIFDSPAKTYEELEYALVLGVHINANSIEELDRIAKLKRNIETKSKIGIRINPEVGTGKIDTTSVSLKYSKFGVSISEKREEIINAFKRFSWLIGIQLHIGSQGMSLDQLTKGTQIVYGLFQEVGGASRIQFFDIGGGLPAHYHDSDSQISFKDYANEVMKYCPDLLDEKINIITEFGRSVHANNGWTVSKIEYKIRQNNDFSTLIIHVGADMFVREAYRPKEWHHDLSACNRYGELLSGKFHKFDVAGPLCFAGDYLGRDCHLPSDIEENDYILIHDSGAYTYSMWSCYNSRQFPSVIGYFDQNKFFHIIKKKSLENIVNFWSMEV